MKYIVGIQIDGVAEKQLPTLREFIDQFAEALPTRISIGGARIVGFQEVKNEVSKSKSTAAKQRRASKQDEGP